jgi:hypothetical protein
MIPSRAIAWSKSKRRAGSPHERRDMRDRRPRISLRSCGLPGRAAPDRPGRRRPTYNCRLVAHTLSVSITCRQVSGETPLEGGSHAKVFSEAGRDQMPGVQRNRISGRQAARAAGPQNLSGTLREVRRQRLGGARQLRRSRRADPLLIRPNCCSPNQRGRHLRCSPPFAACLEGWILAPASATVPRDAAQARGSSTMRVGQVRSVAT